MPIFAAIEHTHTTRKILAVRQGSWAALAESSLVYDPRSMWNTWLVTRFFDGLGRDLRQAMGNIEEGVDVVCRAARDALTLEVPSEHGIPSLMFSVVLDRGAEAWVYNLGIHLVLRLGHERTDLAVWPHSLLGERIAKGHHATERDDPGGSVPTVVATSGKPWESEVRYARVAVGPGEWILIAPPSIAAYDLSLDHPPRNPEELQGVVDMLAKPYAQYTRTWVALRREDG
jgi:hypothetical protein